MEQKELERAIITSVLKDTTKIDDLIEKTTKEHFKDSISRQTYEWMFNRYQQDKKISIAQLSRTDIEVEQLLDYHHPLEEFSDLLDLLDKDYQRRRIKKGVNEINNILQDEDLTVEELQNKAQEVIFQKTNTLNQDEGIHTLQEALEEAYNSLIEQGKDDKVNGIPTGYPSIDSRIGGLQNAHLTVIAGQTSMGKTAFSINLAYRMIKEGYHPFFVSLEMSKKEIADRLLLIDSKVDATDYNTILEDWQMKNVTESMNRYFEKKMTICDKRGMTVENIKAKCRKLSRQEDIDIIFVDYLQMIQLPNNRENTARRVGQVVLQLRNLSKELDLPIVLLSQLNRDVNGKPQLRHLRDSGNIEEIADEVWFLYRKVYENAEQPERQEADLLRKKGRTSGTGKIGLVWYPKYQLFRDSFIEEQEGDIWTERGN